MIRPQSPNRIKVARGDILQDYHPILVCPVNCIRGVMGKGLAKQFATAFPMLSGLHADAVDSGFLRVGQCRMVKANLRHSRYIGSVVRDVVLFPTKFEWRNPSRYEWVFSGLASLYPILSRIQPDDDRELGIAVPALGCGEGGLDLDVIKPMISTWAAGLPRCFHVTFYLPPEGK